MELLDNLRFDPGETEDDPGFVEQLVAGHDMYVNDALRCITPLARLDRGATPNTSLGCRAACWPRRWRCS